MLKKDIYIQIKSRDFILEQERLFNEGLQEGYNKALENLAVPLKEWDKLLWNDKAWNDAGEEYIAKYKEIMEQLPTHSRYLLTELEQIEMKQSDRTLRLLYNYVRSNKVGVNDVE